MILMVDNYDSFTFNLVQAIARLEPDVRVVRNDEFDVAEELSRKPRRIVISPGPGRPEDAGRIDRDDRAAERQGIPLLGVCLGHQAIAVAHGATVSRAPVPVHGKTSRISHDGRGIFAGLSNPFEATRYHSLAVAERTLSGGARDDRAFRGRARHGDSPSRRCRLRASSSIRVDSLDRRAEVDRRTSCAGASIEPPRRAPRIAERRPLSGEDGEGGFPRPDGGPSDGRAERALLLGLAARGETPEEVAGAVSALRAEDDAGGVAPVAARGHLRHRRRRRGDVQRLDGGGARLRRRGRAPLRSTATAPSRRSAARRTSSRRSAFPSKRLPRRSRRISRTGDSRFSSLPRSIRR